MLLFNDRFSTRFLFSTQKELGCRNLAIQERRLSKSSAGTQCFFEVQNFYRKAQTNTWMRGIKTFFLQTLRTRLTFLSVTFSYLQIRINTSQGKHLSPGQPSDLLFSSACLIYPKRPIDQHFNEGLGDWGSVWKLKENTLKSWSTTFSWVVSLLCINTLSHFACKCPRHALQWNFTRNCNFAAGNMSFGRLPSLRANKLHAEQENVRVDINLS